MLELSECMFLLLLMVDDHWESSEGTAGGTSSQAECLPRLYSRGLPSRDEKPLLSGRSELLDRSPGIIVGGRVWAFTSGTSWDAFFLALRPLVFFFVDVVESLNSCTCISDAEST